MWPWHWHNNPVECSYLFWSVSLTCLMCLFFFVSIRSCHVICSTAHGGWTKFVCSGLWIILRELTVYFKFEIHFTWFKTIRYVKSYTICISYSFCIVIKLLLFFVLFFFGWSAIFVFILILYSCGLMLAGENAELKGLDTI